MTYVGSVLHHSSKFVATITNCQGAVFVRTEIRPKDSCVLPVNVVEDADTPALRGVSVGQGAPTPNISLETTTRVTGSTLKKPRVLLHKTPESHGAFEGGALNRGNCSS